MLLSQIVTITSV